jgi:hypothetical protein
MTAASHTSRQFSRQAGSQRLTSSGAVLAVSDHVASHGAHRP